MLLDHGVGPGGIVETGQVPSGNGFAGVDDFAPLLVGAQDFAGTCFPGIVGGDDVGRSIGIGDLELGGKNRAGAVLGQAHPAEPARIPSVGNDGGKGVLAGIKEVRDIGGLDHDALGVIGPAGGEQGIARAAAIDRCLVDSQGRGVQTGLCDGAFYA